LKARPVLPNSAVKPWCYNPEGGATKATVLSFEGKPIDQKACIDARYGTPSSYPKFDNPVYKGPGAATYTQPPARTTFVRPAAVPTFTTAELTELAKNTEENLKKCHYGRSMADRELNLKSCRSASRTSFSIKDGKITRTTSTTWRPCHRGTRQAADPKAWC